MVVARRYLISGRVQGVGYRFFTLEAGAREGLGGFVRNLEDGRVEAQAEGEQTAMWRLLDGMRTSASLPAGAVLGLQVKDPRLSPRVWADHSADAPSTAVPTSSAV